MSQDDVITRDELGSYYQRLGFSKAYGDELAQVIVDSVKFNREPEYIDNASYVDAYGEAWRFSAPNSDGGWDEPVWNAFGDMHEYAFNVPKRPLTRLVPE